VLGYLAAGCVCVVNDAADHAVFFESGRNGLLIDDPEAAGEAIGSLLGDASRRQAMADAASRDYEASLSVAAAADRVEGVIREVLGSSDQD
jgi:glycosyltransferase involved in cell wall biosynthesis